MNRKLMWQSLLASIFLTFVTGFAGVQTTFAQTPIDLSSGATVRLDNQPVGIVVTNFPAGTIDPAQVTVTLEPTAGGKPVTLTAVSISAPKPQRTRQYSGGRRRTPPAAATTTRIVNFIIPESLNLTVTTNYLVSISGTTAEGTAFTTRTRAALTVKPVPRITNVTVGAGSPGQTLTLTITALGIDLQPGVTQVSLGAGISVGGGAVGGFGPATVINATTLSVEITVQPNAVAGARTVRIRTGEDLLARAAAFDVAALTLAVNITSPVRLTLINGTTTTVTGTVDASVTNVDVNGITATISNGVFTATNVRLQEGTNLLTATARDAANNVSTATVAVTRDTDPPTVMIDSPTDGATLTSTAVSITGMVNDVVGGTVNAEQVTVTVNGVPATVFNRTFNVPELLLVRGSNTLTAVARDRAGNENRSLITVNVQDAAGQQRMVLVSGNNQEAMINTMLPEPLVVQLIDAGNAPLPNRPVTFTVRRSDGIVKSAIAQNQEVTVTTDADGRASVGFQLGTRSGVGNNTVLVTASGFAGEMMFSASARAGAPSSIKGAMLRNDTQYGIVGKPLAQSYQVIVVDAGGNPVTNSPVIFNVEAGGGNIEGQGSVTRNTDADGKASVVLTLGMQEGVNNNIVTATFEGFTGDPVSFLASGQTLGAATATRIVGVVLDMQNRPIPHAEVKVVGCALCPTDLATFTDAQGQFAIPNAPVGALTLYVDGATTTRPEEFPHLTYQFTTVAGQDNTVGRPIQLPIVDVGATKIVGGNEDVVLTMTGVPGVAFTVFANSARTASGEKYVGPLTLSQVSSDKAPMPLPNNSAPQVVWTLQPANIQFDKPIQVQLPNTTGMPPGQVIEVFSFDHALEQFVSGGLARVSPDGSVIVSDPGFGINVSGWGGAPPPPPPPTCAGSCDDKNACTIDRCEKTACVHTRITTPNIVEQCRTTRCDAGRGIITEQKDDGTDCNDNDFCTQEESCSSGECKGKKIEDKTLPGVTFSFNADKLFAQFIEPVESIFGKDAPILPVIQISGSKGATESCCSEKREIVRNESLAGSVTIGQTLEVPVPDLALPIPPKFGQIGVFVTFSETGTIEANFTEDNCADLLDGALTGRFGFTLTGAIKAVAPADLASVSGSLQSGLMGGLVGRIRGNVQASAPAEAQVKVFGTFQGITGNFTIQLANGILEAQFSRTLVEPKSIEGSFSFTIPNL